MKSKKLLNTLSYLFFLALGIFLFYYTFQKSDFSAIQKNLQSIEYQWLFVVLISTITAYWARNERWYLLLKTANYQPNKWNVFKAMMLGYFVNLSIPRLGEISRSIALQKEEKIPFNTTIGTVIIERIIDIICLFLIVLIVGFLEYHKINSFLIIHIFPILIKIKLLLLMYIKWAFLVFFLTISILFLVRKKLIELFKKMTSIQLIADFKTGILSIIHLKERGLFLFYTILIWCMYFCTSYFCFLTLTEGKKLGLEAGITVLAFGSIARSLPIQGGSMGAYHFTVAQILLLFGISKSTGESIALIIHSSQLLFQILIGGFCSFLFFISSKKKTTKNDSLL